MPVLPRYGGQSLLNVPPTICAALGVATDGLAPQLDPAILPPAMTSDVSAVVLLVFDGLGRWQLDAAIAAGDAPTFARLQERAARGDRDVALGTISSVFPSSTMPALTTLNTGLPPAAHGLIGWTVYLEEFGEPAEIARWGPAGEAGSYMDDRLGGRDPVAFFGLPTLHRRLARGGVRPYVVHPAPHRGSGLSKMIFRDAEDRSLYANSSLLATVERVLAARPSSERAYLYGYWPSVDTVAHQRGPSGAEHSEEVAVLDFVLGRWLDRYQRRGDLLVLLTADHGHVPSDPRRVVRLDLQPGLLGLLVSPPTGERRLAYLHARPGRAGAVRAYCGERLAGVAELLDPEEAFERGLFGPGPTSAATRRRAGDQILLAREDYQFVCPFSPRQEPHPLLGNHGALDPREMLVPLVALRL